MSRLNSHYGFENDYKLSQVYTLTNMHAYVQNIAVRIVISREYLSVYPCIQNALEAA